MARLEGVGGCVIVRQGMGECRSVWVRGVAVSILERVQVSV